MICLIQRVTQSQVSVNNEIIGKISNGMMVLVAFKSNDNQQNLSKMCDKLLKYRLFSDANNRMNLNIQQKSGDILLIPQFTLAANTKSGLRPSFSSCASPEIAEKLFMDFYNLCVQQYPKVAKGKFGANMQVSLTNDGPVTFKLET